MIRDAIVGAVFALVILVAFMAMLGLLEMRYADIDVMYQEELQ